MSFLTIIVAFLILSAVLFLLLRFGVFRFSWLQFYIRGKESGFSFSEISLLRRVAIANKLKQPESLFRSVKTLDRCIRSAIVGYRAAGSTENARNVEFLNKLFDFRTRVEFSQPKYRLGLSSTRGITPGQPLKVMLSETGIYQSKLVETNRRYMAITYPRGKALPPGFSWKKQELKVYFWRKEDAGYYFETRVVGDFLERKVPILHIAHVDDIVRTQKRRSVRREARVPAVVFPLKSINQANESPERAGGYRGKLIDISEDGAAVAVGGRVKAGLPVKIQASPGEDTVILNGVVKSAGYQRGNNTSVLHIQAQRPSGAMRIRILTYVYALFDSDTSGSPRKGGAGTVSGKPKNNVAAAGGAPGGSAAAGAAAGSAAATPSGADATRESPSGENNAGG